MNQPLAEAIFWIAALACVVAEVAILRSTFRARRAPHPEQATVRNAPEVLWAVLPAVALAAALVFTWRRVEARDLRPVHHHGAAQPVIEHGGHPAAPRQ